MIDIIKANGVECRCNQCDDNKCSREHLYRPPVMAFCEDLPAQRNAVHYGRQITLVQLNASNFTLPSLSRINCYGIDNLLPGETYYG